MICWLSNGEGPLGAGAGAGGQHYKPPVVVGGRLRNKNLAGGGGSPKK